MCVMYARVLVYVGLDRKEKSVIYVICYVIFLRLYASLLHTQASVIVWCNWQTKMGKTYILAGSAT